MAKDSFWFRHDSGAGRGLRIRKIQHLYTHWGKGIYWDVIEILREQEGYNYPNDESSLQLLCSLIGCSDTTKFINWYKDCVKIDLLQEDGNVFFCAVLTENMVKWETKKRNGSEPKSETISESEAKSGEKRREDKIIEYIKLFQEFRELYGGTKRGNDTEFDNFCKKHKDWEQVLPLLKPAVISQINERDAAALSNKFYPEWKNLSTWINQRCWENTTVATSPPGKSKLKTTPEEYRKLYTD